MIKPVSALQYGDLVFFERERWQVYRGGIGYKLLWPLDNSDEAIAIDLSDGNVAVYAHRDSFDHIPF